MLTDTLLTAEQTTALQSLTQRERIDVVLNVLVRYLEKSQRKQALRRALAVVKGCNTKNEAVAQLEAEIRNVN